MKIKQGLVLIVLFAFFFVLSGLGTESSALETIQVPADKALILGKESKYIIIDQIETLDDIPDSAWNSAAGTYQKDSIINVTGNSQIGSTVSAKIGSITGDELSSVNIIQQSNITINNNAGPGIDVGGLEISKTEASQKTILDITGKDAGIAFFTNLSMRYTQLTVKGNNFGIHCKNDELYSDSEIMVGENSSCTVEASGTNGVAMEGKRLYSVASDIKANAPNGISGIKMENTLMADAAVVNDAEIPSKIYAFSKRGRAVTVGFENMGGNISVMNSILYGETSKGEAGVHSDGINAYTQPDFKTQAVIEGKADIGYGVVGQSLDSDQEFPSGGISGYDSIIKGHVNEGMGISSFILSANKSQRSSEVTGIAEKGLGISVCSAYVDSTKMTGISKGSSKKHFQVYDSIADSAGINYLSYFMAYGDSQVIGTAPKDDKDSFGIHGLLYSEDKMNRSGYLNISTNTDTKQLKMNAEGGVGLHCGNFSMYAYDDNSVAEIDADGSVDGIQYEALDFYIENGSESKRQIDITATGASGAGIRSLPPINCNNRVSIDGADIKAKGAQYGFTYEGENESTLKNSTITATAVKGQAISFVNSSTEQLNPFTIESCNIKATGKTRGMLIRNMNVNFKNQNNDSSAIFQADGVALQSVFTSDVPSDNITGLLVDSVDQNHLMKVEAVSRQVPPDKQGRKPSVVSPEIKVTKNGELIERYLKPIQGTISTVPYMAYAAGQNMMSPVNYDWTQSSTPIYAAEDGIYSDKKIDNLEMIIGLRAQNITEEPVLLEDGGSHKVIMGTDKKKFKVNFDTAGGKPHLKSQEYPAGSIISKPGTVTKGGFKLIGWINKETGKYWDFSSDLMPEHDITLVASWQSLDGSNGGNESNPGNSEKKGSDQNTRTGDNNYIPYLFLAMAVSLAAILFVKRYRRK